MRWLGCNFFGEPSRTGDQRSTNGFDRQSSDENGPTAETHALASSLVVHWHPFRPSIGPGTANISVTYMNVEVRITLTRRRCWLEWCLLAFGTPALIVGLTRLVSLTGLESHFSTADERYVVSILGGVMAEWIVVAGAWYFLRRRNETLGDFGTWKPGHWAGWVFALSFAGLSIASNLRFLPRMGVPVSAAFAPRGSHLVAALALGITAGFCEEFLFRGLLMTDFARSGYGKGSQVILPGIAFGLSHLGYSGHGLLAAVGIMVPTALLGMLWGIAYLLGRRGLLPCMVAHFLNDATALPWIGFFMFKGALG